VNKKVNNLLYHNQKLLIERDDLRSKIEDLRGEVRMLQDNIGRIARDAVIMELKMLYGEDYESLQEMYRWQKEFMRREQEKSSA